MSTKEQARELMVEERLQEGHRHETMLNRAVEAVETQELEETEAKARELMIGERKREEKVQDTMLTRAAAEIQPD